MKEDLGKIATGSRVAVVGGGPSGSFFALYLLKYAVEEGVSPEITIYEPRNFAEPGPMGCKGCAGILSMSLLQNLGEIGLTLPKEIIQGRIEQYTVHSPYASITLSKPAGDIQIVSVYRGGGPRLSHDVSTAGFDDWLLGQAEKRGARVQRERVTSIYPGREAGIEVGGKELKYDLVVLASGVNTPPVKLVGLDYIPPKTQFMAQDEIYLGIEEVKSRLGNAAHAFLLPRSGVIFGTLVPKGPFVNVSVLSRAEHPVSVSSFLKYDLVQQILPQNYVRACGCRPKAAVGPAQNYYADRFVTVGDAAVSRLYKDGIGSSLLTAREAARTAVYHGLSQESFKSYYHTFRNSISRDNEWGKKLFSMTERAKDSRLFLLAQHRLIGNEQSNMRSRQFFTRAAWGMFTGSYSYRSIASMSLNPISQARLYLALLQEGVKSLFQRQVSAPRQLQVVGRKVLILGSGFGGTYVLRNLVPALNRNENVETTMVSDENFFLFSPLLHEVAMGRIETRHIAYPIRRLHWRDRFNFVQASVRKIDLTQRRVLTTRGSFDFDYLVLALGSVTNTSELGRIGKGGNVFTLKTLHDSRLIRNHIIGLFEQASLEKRPERRRQMLTFVICGGGYTGVQLVTELRDFIYRNLLRFYRTIEASSIRIILLEAEAKIAAELHPKLGAYVMKHLKRTGIEVRLRSRATRIWRGGVEINHAESVPASTVIWVAGVVAHPLIAGLPVERDNIGRVMVNEYLEIPEVEGVYAVGDCAHFKNPRSGRPIPPRAHTAVRQARVVARNILANIRGRDKRLYHYTNSAEAVSLGSTDAAVRFYGLRLYGLLARLIWLLGYSYLVTGAPNRVRIVMDWLLSLVFGRDVTFIKLSRLG
ncbi:MAG: FAD-dependent oxidoreductase [Dehalococcoidales bacterium]|nr:FAD-dependent oxidoreductase [Dehalococcoidales bacterium]